MHRRIRLDGDPAPVRGLRAMLASFLRDRCVDEKTARAVVLAFSEALDNAMEHGLSGMPGEVHVRLRYTPRFILLSLRDTGSDKVPLGHAVKAGPDEERGRGFALMNELMDYVRVKVFPDGGTRVTLMRRFDGRRG
ncbi:MAG: ATP-binding protein [Planctomycetes bacterium]|nr:ATP-binding protein [Planctomycetota bacterium]